MRAVETARVGLATATAILNSLLVGYVGELFGMKASGALLNGSTL